MNILTPDKITLGVVFTGKRSDNLDTFFSSCIFNDILAAQCKFLIVDNACTFDLEGMINTWFAKRFPKHPKENRRIIKNEKIESLPFNHNLIYFNSNTSYILHHNDEVWFQKKWLTKTLEWINAHDENAIAHLCRCSKGYWRSVIEKWGYFNLMLPTKECSDTDCEWREAKFLQGKNITLDQWRSRYNFNDMIIGGSWKQEYFEPLKCMSWVGEICAQPGDPAVRDNDSNRWLVGDPNLSERNKSVGKSDGWEFVGKQGLQKIDEELFKR